MGRRVIVHRYEESPSGANRIVESGAFDPEADDNPEWVTEALANRPEPTEEPQRLTEWEEPRDAAPQPSTVLDSIEFGEETALPEGLEEPAEDDEEPYVDPEPQPATVIASVEFDAAAGEQAEEEPEPEPEPERKTRRSAKKDDADDE
jgi:hypothetical protein